MNSAYGCRLCGHTSLGVLLDLGRQPIAHRLLEVDEDDRVLHPLKIHYCENCGLGQIVDPIDPEILYRDYNYCFTSWKPEPHRSRQVELLASAKPAASIFEIGCNDGLFLDEMKKAGMAIGVGLEPNRIARKVAEDRGFRVYDSFLNSEIVPAIVDEYGKFDIVVARQVLEHIQDIDLFYGCARHLLKDDGFLFIEVPDIEPSLKVGDLTIAWEEHVNYFSEDVLLYASARHGFTPNNICKSNFSGGCLSVLFGKTNPVNQVCPSDLQLLKGMEASVESYWKLLTKLFESAKLAGSKIVLYGVGCRACAFVNGLGLSDQIDFAVDDQVEKVGKYMPGSKLPIHSSESLSRTDNALVLLAVNQENEDRVVQSVAQRETGGSYKFVSVLGPTAIADNVRDALIFYETR